MRLKKMHFYKQKPLMQRLYDETPVAPKGITLFGCGGARPYKNNQKYSVGEFEVERMANLLQYVDIFASHCPPRDIHDEPGDDIHTGFSGYVSYIEQKQPQIFIHGHMHKNIETTIKNTRIIGTYGMGKISISVREFSKEDI